LKECEVNPDLEQRREMEKDWHHDSQNLDLVDG
jgi:hypothetical protein